MILFDASIQILALSEPNRLEPASRSILQTGHRIAGYDGFRVGPAAIDDNAIGTPMALESLR
jgi:hypothetical protein